MQVNKQPAGWWAGLVDRLTGRRQRQALEMMQRDIAELRSMLTNDGRRFVENEFKTLRDHYRHMRDGVIESEIGTRRNIRFALDRLAVVSSAQLVAEAMPRAQSFSHPHDTLRHALTLAPRGGLSLEFGVYSGTTLEIIARQRGDGRVFGFDSFKGLPEAWRTDFPVGAFAVDQLPKVEGAELVVGWFDETLPAFLASHPGPVDFLHVDCDLYSSTRTVFELVGPRLRPGSVVMFDEFFNYSGWQQHEYKAWKEFVASTGLAFEYEAYTFNNEQVAVRLTAVATRTP